MVESLLDPCERFRQQGNSEPERLRCLDKADAERRPLPRTKGPRQDSPEIRQTIEIATSPSVGLPSLPLPFRLFKDCEYMLRVAEPYVALHRIFPQSLERIATRTVEQSITQAGAADLGCQE